MGTTAFPSSLYACILAEGYEVEPVEDVTIQTTADGSELRLHNGTRWRASFSLVTKTSTERSALLTFAAARKGAWDSFPFTAPDDDVVRQVRFDGAIRGRHLGRGMFAYPITLIEVVA